MKTALNTNNKTRLNFVSWLQVIGVLSVVFGHSINDIAVPDFIVDIKAWVYLYHMPLFFLVSAFLFSYKGCFSKGYKTVFKGRAIRLLIPFYFWNALFLFPKVLLSEFTNDKITLSPEYFINMLICPRNSVLGHTWFLFALFEMFVIAILFEKLLKNKKLWIPVTAALILVNCFGTLNMYFAISDLMKNAIFFWIGLMLGTLDIEKITAYCKSKSVFISFFLLVAGGTVLWCFHPESKINSFILGLASLFLFVIIQIRFNITGRFIDFVSKYSFPIYIMHWPVMMLIRAVVYIKLGFHPVLTMFIMFFGGVFIPCLAVLVIKKFKGKFFEIIFKYTLGM